MLCGGINVECSDYIKGLLYDVGIKDVTLYRGLHPSRVMLADFDYGGVYNPPIIYDHLWNT